MITALIRRLVTQGQTVAAIKHTHHPLADERRGDTARFEQAGASPVILAGDGEAVLWTAAACRRLSFKTPADVLNEFNVDVVLIEGFKSYDRWPRINAADVRSVEEAIALLDRIP